MGEASFLSSQFADGEADAEKGPFAKASGSGSNRGDSWLPASNFTWGDRKAVRMNPKRGLKQPNSPREQTVFILCSGRRWSLQKDLLTGFEWVKSQLHASVRRENQKSLLLPCDVIPVRQGLGPPSRAWGRHH